MSIEFIVNMICDKNQIIHKTHTTHFFILCDESVLTSLALSFIPGPILEPVPIMLGLVITPASLLARGCSSLDKLTLLPLSWAGYEKAAESVGLSGGLA